MSLTHVPGPRGRSTVTGQSTKVEPVHLRGLISHHKHGLDAVQRKHLYSYLKPSLSPHVDAVEPRQLQIKPTKQITVHACRRSEC